MDPGMQHTGGHAGSNRSTNSDGNGTAWLIREAEQLGNGRQPPHPDFFFSLGDGHRVATWSGEHAPAVWRFCGVSGMGRELQIKRISIKDALKTLPSDIIYSNTYLEYPLW